MQIFNQNAMNFLKQKQQIIKSLEHGDKAKIVKRVRVSRPTLDKALSRNSISEMSAHELRAWKGCLKFIKLKMNSRATAESETDKIVSSL